MTTRAPASARSARRTAVAARRSPSRAAVSVRLPKELPALSPGFYTVVSDAPTDPRRRRASCASYWNVTPPGAPALVGALTSRLNAAGVPFRLKVADHPFRLERCDAAVLYLRSEVVPTRWRDPLRDVAAELTAASPAADSGLHARARAPASDSPRTTTPEARASASGDARCSRTGSSARTSWRSERTAARLEVVVERFAAGRRS